MNVLLLIERCDSALNYIESGVACIMSLVVFFFDELFICCARTIAGSLDELKTSEHSSKLEPRSE